MIGTFFQIDFTLVKLNNGITSVLVYRKPTHTDEYLHYSFHYQGSCKEDVVFSLLEGTYSIVANEDGLTKENIRVKHVLKDKRYKKA